MSMPWRRNFLAAKNRDTGGIERQSACSILEQAL
jgi:hypothetical protein